MDRRSHLFNLSGLCLLTYLINIKGDKTMPRVLRIGRVELRVLDLEKSVDYYTNIIGLEETGRIGNSVYLKAWDEWDHHSVILTKSNTTWISTYSF